MSREMQVVVFPLLLKVDERSISFLLLTMILPSTEVLNLDFGEGLLRL